MVWKTCHMRRGLVMFSLEWEDKSSVAAALQHTELTVLCAHGIWHEGFGLIYNKKALLHNWAKKSCELRDSDVTEFVPKRLYGIQCPGQSWKGERTILQDGLRNRGWLRAEGENICFTVCLLSVIQLSHEKRNSHWILTCDMQFLCPSS